jgi:hypothetical protein
MRELSSPLKKFHSAHKSMIRSFISFVEDFEIRIITSGRSALVQVGRKAWTTPSLEWCRTSATSVIGTSMLDFCHTCKNSSVVCVVTRLWAGIPRNRGCPACRPTVRPILPPDKWLPEPLLPRQNGRLAKLTTHPHLVSRVRMSEVIPPLMAYTANLPICVCVCARARAHVLRDKPYLDSNTFDSCLGPRYLFCNVYVIWKAHPGKFRIVCSGNRVRAVAE